MASRRSRVAGTCARTTESRLFEVPIVVVGLHHVGYLLITANLLPNILIAVIVNPMEKVRRLEMTESRAAGHDVDGDGVPGEIVCDESGYEGEKLIDTTTAVFAHASVVLGDEAAEACIRRLRAMIGSPATQYKAGHLLRGKHRAALEWFLGPDGPLPGRGSVFLLDKAHFVAVELAALLGVDPATVDRSPYVLAAANDLLRGRDRPGVVDEFFRVSGRTAGRERAELFRSWLRADPVVNSVLDPLVPALVAAVRRWGPVTVAHDRQVMLPARRVDHIRELCGGRLAGVRFLDAESHPRIQVADILAGTVRHIAEQELAGRGDPALTALARPFVDCTSVWNGPSLLLSPT